MPLFLPSTIDVSQAWYDNRLDTTVNRDRDGVDAQVLEYVTLSRLILNKQYKREMNNATPRLVYAWICILEAFITKPRRLSLILWKTPYFFPFFPLAAGPIAASLLLCSRANCSDFACSCSLRSSSSAALRSAAKRLSSLTFANLARSA